MFFSSIFLKSVRDLRRSLFWWSLAVVLYCSSITFLYDTMADSLVELVKYYPPELGKMFGIDIATLASPSGWFNAEIYAMMLPICFIAFFVFSGANAIANEEETRTLEILLSEPVSRGRLYLEKFVALIFNGVVISIVTFVSIAVPSIIISMDIGMGKIIAATLNLTLMATLLGTLAFAISASLGKRRTSLIIPVGFAIISYVSNVASMFASWVDGINRFSIFNYYRIEEAFENGIDLGIVLGFVSSIALVTFIGYLRFQRRDLRF